MCTYVSLRLQAQAMTNQMKMKLLIRCVFDSNVLHSYCIANSGSGDCNYRMAILITCKLKMDFTGRVHISDDNYYSEVCVFSVSFFSIRMQAQTITKQLRMGLLIRCVSGIL